MPEEDNDADVYMLSQFVGRPRRIQRNVLLEDILGDDETGEEYCEECLHEQSWRKKIGIYTLQGESEQHTPLQIRRVFGMTWGWPDIIGIITFLLVLFTFLHEWGIVT